MSRIPNRIFADRGPLGGWMYRDYQESDTEHEFIRVGEVKRILDKERGSFNDAELHAVDKIAKLLEQI